MNFDLDWKDTQIKCFLFLVDLRTLVIHGRHRLGVGMGSDCEVHDKISDNSIRVLHKLGRLSSIHIFDCKVRDELIMAILIKMSSHMAGRCSVIMDFSVPIKGDKRGSIISSDETRPEQ